jgi:hypothetical protein
LNQPLALAVNDVSVIVATTANYIRIFTLSGLQVHIFNLSNMVAIAAAADLALLVYHGGIGVKGKHEKIGVTFAVVFGH